MIYIILIILFLIFIIAYKIKSNENIRKNKAITIINAYTYAVNNAKTKEEVDSLYIFFKKYSLRLKSDDRKIYDKLSSSILYFGLFCNLTKRKLNNKTHT